MAAIAPPTGSSPMATATIDPFLHLDSREILIRDWGKSGRGSSYRILLVWGIELVFRNTAQMRNSVVRLQFIWEVAAARDLRFIH